MEFLDAIYELNLEMNLLREDQLAQLIRALNNIAVQPVLLKGAAALVRGLYPTPGERMIGDIDVLLPPSKLPEAVDRLCSLGYQPVGAEKKLPDAQNIGFHHYRALISHYWPAQVELHVHPVLLEVARLLDGEEVFRDATSLHWRDDDCLLPSATHFVMHNVIHAYVMDLRCHYVLSLRQLFDFVNACRTYAGQIDWAVIQQRFESLGYGYALRSYVALASAYLGFQTPAKLASSIWDPARRRYYRMQLNHPVMHFLFLLLAGPLRLHARTLIIDPRIMTKVFSVRRYMRLYQVAKTQPPY